MRCIAAALLLLIACEKDEAKTEAAPVAPKLPSVEEVCVAYKAIDTPEGVFVLTATATQGSIKRNFDGSAVLAEVTELRAESEPPQGERQRHNGSVTRLQLTLTQEGENWVVTNQKVDFTNEIFHVRRPVGDDPRTLFGDSIVERYGPKGGTTCVGAVNSERRSDGD